MDEQRAVRILYASDEGIVVPNEENNWIFFSFQIMVNHDVPFY